MKGIVHIFCVSIDSDSSVEGVCCRVEKIPILVAYPNYIEATLLQKYKFRLIYGWIIILAIHLITLIQRSCIRSHYGEFVFRWIIVIPVCVVVRINWNICHISWIDWNFLIDGMYNIRDFFPFLF